MCSSCRIGYTIVDEASAIRDGVHSGDDMAKYYGVGTYVEDDLTYTFEALSYGSRTAQLDLTEYIKSYFAAHT